MDLSYPISIYPDLKLTKDVAYYIDLIEAKPFFWDICRFDHSGIPRVDYGPKTGLHWNKTFICQWALANLNQYLKTDKTHHLRVYEAQIEWLLNNVEYQDGDRSRPLWYNHFDFVHQGQSYPAPWTGGLGHALAISLFIRDFRLRGQKESLEFAQRLSWFLFLDVEKGGLMFKKGKDLFFEEYPKPPFTRILDGLLYMILAVYDLADQTGIRHVQDKFEQACDTLERHLPRWDFEGCWSYYDIHGRQLANPSYHAMNYCLLEVLGRITGKKALREKAEEWQRFKEDEGLRAKINSTYFRLLPDSCWHGYRDPRNGSMDRGLQPRKDLLSAAKR